MMRKIFAAMAVCFFMGTCLAQPAFDARARLEELGYLPEGEQDYSTAIAAFKRANGLPEETNEDEILALLMDENAISCDAYLSALSAQTAGHALLQTGSTGEAVTELQTRLSALGYDVPEERGNYDEQTMRAVYCFQLACGLTASGKADASLWLRLTAEDAPTQEAFLQNAVCAPGDQSDAVRLLQRRLRRLGYFSGDCSGVYGDKTAEAVQAFQEANGLELTQRADADTCRMLYSGMAAREVDEESLIDDQTEQGRLVLARLFELGYLKEDGKADRMAALKLFRMAVSADDDEAGNQFTVSRLLSEDALTFEAAQARFAEMQVTELNDALAYSAQRARGETFSYGDATGFAFVQQLCLDAGYPLISEEQLLALPVAHVDDAMTTQPGDVVIFARLESDWTQLVCGVCTQPGYIAYATNRSGYVLESAIRTLTTGEVSVWRAA